MNFSKSKDERLLAFYENVRRRVELDSRAAVDVGSLAKA
jgi:hypothetical protein